MLQRFLILFLSLIFAVPVLSQDTVAQKKTRKRPHKSYLIHERPWEIEIPLWIPGFRGQFSYGDVTIGGGSGADPGDPGDPDDDEEDGILSKLFTKEWYLNFVFLGKTAYESKGFLAQLDGFGGGVGNSIKFNYNNKEIVQASIQLLNFRLFLGYRLWQKTSNKENFRYELYAYLGMRMHFYKIYSKLNGVVNKMDINPVWAEPIIGIQNQFNFKRWQIILQGDIGGVLVNEKYSTMLQGSVYYRTGRLTSIKFGWGHLAMNHNNTFKDEDLKINVTLTGPSAGLTFHF